MGCIMRKYIDIIRNHWKKMIFLFVFVWIVISNYSNYLLYRETNERFIRLLHEKYIPNKETPASQFIEDMFPNVDTKKYTYICAMKMLGNSDGFLPLLDGFYFEIGNSSYGESFLMYPPYLIIIASKDLSDVKYIKISYENFIKKAFPRGHKSYINYVGGNDFTYENCAEINNSYFNAVRSNTDISIYFKSKKTIGTILKEVIM